MKRAINKTINKLTIKQLIRMQVPPDKILHLANTDIGKIFQHFNLIVLMNFNTCNKPVHTVAEVII